MTSLKQKTTFEPIYNKQGVGVGYYHMNRGVAKIGFKVRKGTYSKNNVVYVAQPRAVREDQNPIVAANFINDVFNTLNFMGAEDDLAPSLQFVANLLVKGKYA